MNNARYTALQIAWFIINYSNNKNYPVSNLKLQKLLYFVQANYLIQTNNSESGFNDPIEAWAYGPVVPSVYQEFKHFGNSIIPYIESLVIFDYRKGFYRDVSYDEYCGDLERNSFDFNIITNIVDQFSEISAFELVDITHSQRPWQRRYNRGRNNIITCDDIFEYFSEE